MTPQPNWDRIEADVLMSIRCLRAAWEHTEGKPLHAAMVRDLYVPCLMLLDKFCVCVEVRDEETKG